MSSQKPNSQEFTFANTHGESLSARFEQPATEPLARALFAHCFTCSKDVAAASRISRALSGLGIAVLRFDFTGLGNSDGDFSNTNFSSNVDDLVAAADHLRGQGGAPDLLVGHSLGGAAVLAAAGRIPETKAIATLGAPSCPQHVEKLLTGSRAAIEEQGSALVSLAGRSFRIRRQFLEDLDEHNLAERIRTLGRALLVMHSPIDEIVPIDEARRIFEAARHPKSFLSLDGTDHLLTRRPDSEFVANILAAWSSRYVISDED